jgi:hypothetical protein
LKRELNKVTTPMGKNPEPVIGTILWTFLLDDHPNQNKQIGRAKHPIKLGGSTIPGLKISEVSLETSCR